MTTRKHPPRIDRRATAFPLLVLCAGLAACSPAAPPAPPPMVTSTVVAQAITNDDFTLERRGPSQFVMRRIVIEPGGSTGWHYHPGTLLAIVQRGTLTRIDANCRSVVYQAGQSLVEPSGSDHVHVGTNTGSEPVELWVTYIDPVGSELAVTAATPQCPTHPN